ncbi:30S ribosomal protein S17 [Candidatus Shapirobacteria bacterium CG10_big_fil_rev_8_21_14_0_10_38_14]|uniref:Small ribosomal subunit protein uS17 n=1 Tax=Candidatus Shapirobacteria bacterium CG10_big_fil_rev_8_21_14_0_10_38_14 TaxID=1974483 RepID=A0A2M8L5P6_9BACT|nr:MAG: 30S ribosomal protein S17 [Candidatus Shapirobacteria bacterium CG10_big_fil_rev_8_21_14_0_10_38_14]
MKQFKGQVISAKMAKTATVLVERRRVHPLYGKSIKKTKKYQVQDELGAKVGDMVKFVGTKPISKTKKWKITEILT